MSEKDAANKEEKPIGTGWCSRGLGLMGVRFGGEGEQWLVLTRRFPFVLLGLGVLALLAGGWFVHYSSTPAFCRTCHYIEPFVESWETSTHHMVTCGECHFPPTFRGFVRRKVMGIAEVVRTLTKSAGPKPRSEIGDASCLQEGCHDSEALEGQLLFKEKYKFDHRPHLRGLPRGKELRCTSCHSHIVEGEHISVAETVCFTCHFRGKTHDRYLDPVAGCTSCHQVPQQELQVAEDATFAHKEVAERGVECWKCHFDTTQGTGDVSREGCKSCHGELAKLAEYENPALIHEWHVTKRKVECFQCHDEIRHGLHPEPHSAQYGCAACHTDHRPQRDLFAGIGPQGQQGVPGTHWQVQVDCVACHEVLTREPEKPHGAVATYKVTEKACAECHGEAAAGMLGMWQMGINNSLQEAQAELEKAQKAVAALPGDARQRAEAEPLLQRARRNLEFVRTAKGVHNPQYAFELLDGVMEAAGKAAEAAQAGAGW